jgi:hypothetical protein
MYNNPSGGEVDSVLIREPEMLSTMEAGEMRRTLKVITKPSLTQELIWYGNQIGDHLFNP